MTNQQACDIIDMQTKTELSAAAKGDHKMKLGIGEQIRKMRDGKGITQEQLASSLGVTSQAISRWERGK